MLLYSRAEAPTVFYNALSRPESMLECYKLLNFERFAATLIASTAGEITASKQRKVNHKSYFRIPFVMNSYIYMKMPKNQAG